MTYDAIKQELRAAEKQVQAGDLTGADTRIRAMLGEGLTRADMDANLLPGTIKALREHTS